MCLRYLIEPIVLHLSETVFVVYIVNEQHCMCPLEVTVGKTSEPLLTCGIPKLQLHSFVPNV